MYYPVVTTSGIGLTHAIWDFTAVSTPLHVDRKLRLLATVPSGTAEIPIKVTLRARVVGCRKSADVG